MTVQQFFVIQKLRFNCAVGVAHSDSTVAYGYCGLFNGTMRPYLFAYTIFNAIADISFGILTVVLQCHCRHHWRTSNCYVRLCTVVQSYCGHFTLCYFIVIAEAAWLAEYDNQRQLLSSFKNQRQLRQVPAYLLEFRRYVVINELASTVDGVCSLQYPISIFCFCRSASWFCPRRQ